MVVHRFDYMTMHHRNCRNERQRTKLVAIDNDRHPNVHRAICALDITSSGMKVRERF